MSRSVWPLLVVLIAILLPLAGFGQEVVSPATAAATGLDPTLQYILGAGPLGALVYGAWMLGRGVKIRIQVDFADEDRELLKRGVTAAEAIARRNTPTAP